MGQKVYDNDYKDILVARTREWLTAIPTNLSKIREFTDECNKSSAANLIRPLERTWTRSQIEKLINDTPIAVIAKTLAQMQLTTYAIQHFCESILTVFTKLNDNKCPAYISDIRENSIVLVIDIANIYEKFNTNKGTKTPDIKLQFFIRRPMTVKELGLYLNYDETRKQIVNWKTANTYYCFIKVFLNRPFGGGLNDGSEKWIYERTDTIDKLFLEANKFLKEFITTVDLENEVGL